MRSRLVAAAVLVLAGCAVEHGNQPPARSRSAQAARDSGGPLHTVFDRRQEAVARNGVKDS
jgi:hypothetical protein